MKIKNTECRRAGCYQDYWYAIDDLDGCLNALVSRSNRYVSIGQSLSPTKPYYRENVPPDPTALTGLLGRSGIEVVYRLVEGDACCGNREYTHAVLELKV